MEQPRTSPFEYRRGRKHIAAFKAKYYGTANMDSQSTLYRSDLIAGFRNLGLSPGAVVLVHSAMRTFGRIEGGATTVIDALLDVLGPMGTLVVPTFTFAQEAEKDPIVDPATDSSEMGAISEAGRCHPDSRRSVAFRHSFAAIGRRAELVTDVDPSLSPFDLGSTFGIMLDLNTQIMLCGLTYSNSTSHHFAEWVCEVPYRHSVDMRVKVRSVDGSIAEQPMVDYQPKSEGGSYYGTRGPDFDRLGRMLEDAGRVGTAFIGNSAVRQFAMRDLMDLARVEAASDYNVFRTPEHRQGELTPLTFGTVVPSPPLTDGAGRSDVIDWCVADPAKLVMPDVEPERRGG